MPGLLQETPFKTFTVKELHPTFGAEIEGVNFENLADEQFAEIKSALAKYGFAVFRNTGLTDDVHLTFSRRFGELDNIRRYLTPGRKLRYPDLELFDASNLDGEGEIVPSDSPRAHYNKGNAIFHVDSSFNPRRASYSLLRAVEIPPAGSGGSTEFADSRSAWDDLDEDTQKLLLSQVGDGNGIGNGSGSNAGLVGGHSISHSRKMGSPEFFRDLDVDAAPMHFHRVAQMHEPSGRMNLYIGGHLHHIEGLPRAESDALVKRLNAHATQERYVVTVEWNGPGDMVIWDNRAVLHRATGGPFEDKWKRDMRRATVHDDGSYAWGVNKEGEEMPGFDSSARPGEKAAAAAS